MSFLQGQAKAKPLSLTHGDKGKFTRTRVEKVLLAKVLSQSLPSHLPCWMPQLVHSLTALDLSMKATQLQTLSPLNPLVQEAMEKQTILLQSAKLYNNPLVQRSFISQQVLT
jgi:hypothetical protein